MNYSIVRTAARYFSIPLCLILLLCAFAVWAQDDNRRTYEEQIAEYEKMLEAEGPFTEERIEEIEELVQTIEATEYEELSLRSRMLLVLAKGGDASSEEPADNPPADPLLDSLYDYPGEETNVVGAGISLGTGLVSLALFNVFGYLGNSTYENYTAATSPKSGAVLQQRWMLYDTLSYVFLGTSVLSLGISIPLFLSPAPERPELQAPVAEEQAIKQAELTEKKVDRLYNRADRSYDLSRGMETAAYVSVATGLTSLIGTGITLLLADSAYRNYSQASYSSDAERLHREVETLQYASVGLGIGGAASLLTGVMFTLTKPNTLSIHRDIAVAHTSFRRNPSVDFDEENYSSYVKRQIALLEHEKSVLTRKLQQSREQSAGYNAGFWTAIGVGTASLAGMGVCLYLSEKSFNEYNNAAYSDDAEALRRSYRITKTLSIVTGAIGGASWSTAGFLALHRPHPAKIKRELKEVERQLNLFKTRLR